MLLDVPELQTITRKVGHYLLHQVDGVLLRGVPLPKTDMILLSDESACWGQRLAWCMAPGFPLTKSGVRWLAFPCPVHLHILSRDERPETEEGQPIVSAADFAAVVPMSMLF